MSNSQTEPVPRASTDSRLSEVPPSPGAPKLPETSLDVSLSLDQIISNGNTLDPEANEEAQKLQKRASNVMRLAEENEKLTQELREMTERVKAAEQRRVELLRRKEQEETTAS